MRVLLVWAEPGPGGCLVLSGCLVLTHTTVEETSTVDASLDRCLEKVLHLPVPPYRPVGEPDHGTNPSGAKKRRLRGWLGCQPNQLPPQKLSRPKNTGRGTHWSGEITSCPSALFAKPSGNPTYGEPLMRCLVVFLCLGFP